MSKQYDIKVFKMETWWNKYCDTKEEALAEGARLRALYQNTDSNHEYHFEVEEVEEEE
jgi:hypothetical protein